MTCRTCVIPYRPLYKRKLDAMDANTEALLFVIDYASERFRFTTNDIVSDSFKVKNLAEEATDIDWDAVLKTAMKENVITGGDEDWVSLVYVEPEEDPEDYDDFSDDA